MRGWENRFHANGKQKKAGEAILISNKTDLKIKTIIRDKEGLYIMIKGSIQKEGITILISMHLVTASGPITSWQVDGETVADFIFGASESLQAVTAATKLKDACSLEENLYQPRWHIKKQKHYFANKCPSSQGYDFFQ